MAEFRSLAKKHLEMAERIYSSTELDSFPAACVELRMALECIAYDLLKSFEDEVDEETLATWQPGRLIDELKEIDDHLDEDRTIFIGIPEQPGIEPKEKELLGTDIRPSASWIKRSYHALGNFVHERTIAQIRATPEIDVSRSKARFEEIAKEATRILSATLWNANLRMEITVNCTCGFLMVRRESLLRKDGRVKCAQCGEIYRAFERDEDGRKTWVFNHHHSPVKCPHADCGHTNYVADRNVVDGYLFNCEECGQGIRIENRLCAVKPGS